MKAASVSLLFGVCVLLLSALTVSAVPLSVCPPVSLSVSPNLQQFFRGASVSLRCVDDDGQTVDGWTVRRTRGELTEDCGAGAAFRKVDGYSCVLDLSFSSGGSYSCINSSGQQSDEVSIIVTDGSLILEIPALPVRTGSDITLHCRQKNGGTVTAYFLFNGSNVGSGPKSEHTITNIQQSDEGLYSCSTEILGSSRQSFLSVRALPPHVQSTTACTSPDISARPSSPKTSPPQSSSIIPVVAGLVSVILLVLVGVLFFYRKRKGRRDSSPPLDVTYTDVPTTHRDKHHDPADPHAVDSDVMIHTAVTNEQKTDDDGPDEVDYGQVVFKNKKKADGMTEQLTDGDIVYSSVRTGPAEVTYGEMVFKKKKKSVRMAEQLDDGDVVYSSLGSGN